jgi:hypothetical protein
MVNLLFDISDYPHMRHPNKISKIFITAVLAFGIIAVRTIDASNPLCIAIYPHEGAPSPLNQPCAVVITIRSTDTLRLFAKLFDNRAVWLSQFESDTAPISWRVASNDVGMGHSEKLRVTTGSHTMFIDSAGFSVSNLIIATFSLEGYSISDSITVHVSPPPLPSHLVIEPDSALMASPNSDNRLDSISVSCPEKSRTVFAIQRDPFGNFISVSKHAFWQSRDTAVATVSHADFPSGEGIITCKKYGSTWVVAQDSSLGNSILDSVLTDCPMSCGQSFSLRIVNSDTLPVESLTFRVGESVALTAQATWKGSSSNIYVPVAVDWTMPEFLASNLMDPQPPNGHAVSWSVAPHDTGSGWIRIALTNAAAASDSVWISVLPAAAGAHPHTAARAAAALRIGSRVIRVPSNTVYWAMTGIDLRGRVMACKEERYTGGKSVQFKAAGMHTSGMMLITFTLKDERHKVLTEARCISAFIK